MKQNLCAVQVFQRILCLAALAAAVGCSNKSIKGEPITFKMGEAASVGKLLYTVTETNWIPSLGSGAKSRMPQHRFLLVKATVTNNGPAAINVPLLALVDPAKKQYRELDEVDELTGWMGLIRTVKPGSSLSGSMVFDVPVGTYKLQLSDAGELENEQLAYVELTLSMEANPILSEQPALPPMKK
ncbi:MAG: DUF4352 domain-containing protein [Candidatus Solibacter usitatus]|nr:DUF4352 domain-containing protein [Candidatus Solibacter usitatus]